MAVTYNATLKNTRMTDVVTALGSGAILKIGTAGMSTILAQIPLDNPAGTVSGGVLTFSTPLTESSADNSGTAAAAIVVDSGGTTIISGLTVSDTSGDIVLASTTITGGQPFTLTAASIAHG